MCRELGLYLGEDLGAVYSKTSTSFKLWAPTADRVKLCLYREGSGDNLIEEIPMNKEKDGVWTSLVSKDLKNIYYTYMLDFSGKIYETIDPYAVACGVNGLRGMVCDLSSTNPEGFLEDKGIRVEDKTSIVISEISVADTTADASCGAKYPGKYLGLTEKGTVSDKGNPTGLDYIKNLGITHVQLMPSYDFGSIDESQPDKEQYNWGYDPVNYNIPEGSYSTNPFDGNVRILEYKKMVKAFHDNGIGVIMDVVYNHTYDIENSCFNKTVPGYYYRKDAHGNYTDASACSNEVASEKPMMRKYIIDSLKYWVKEYHIDGFRFDLMGVLDIETLNLAHDELIKLKPDIIMYGEGWTGGDSPLPFEKRAMKTNVSSLKGIGMFSDDMRDNVKGHVFYLEKKGFINGGEHKENDIKCCVAGSMHHPQVDYESYTYTDIGDWAKEPEDIINYLSCHDNLTLWDKLSISCPNASDHEKLKMNRLGAAIIFTSQGIPFFLLGEESARTKPVKGSSEVSENSYNLPLYTNSLKYDKFYENRNLYEFYKGLIAFRKINPAFHLESAREIAEKVRFIDGVGSNVVAFIIQKASKATLVVYNANKDSINFKLPMEGQWDVFIDSEKASDTSFRKIKDQTEIPGISCLACMIDC